MVSSISNTLWPQVRIPSTPSALFSIYIVEIETVIVFGIIVKDKNKQKEAGIGAKFRKGSSKKKIRRESSV